jgi:hypothetical protein
LVLANGAAQALLAGVAPHLLAPPVNVLRLSLHPEGLAPRIVNAAQWRAHVLARLAQQIQATADAQLQALYDELAALAGASAGAQDAAALEAGGIVVPLVLDTPQGVLRFIGTTTVFGTPVDVTLQELAIEAFFPADAVTKAALARLLPAR